VQPAENQRKHTPAQTAVLWVLKGEKMGKTLVIYKVTPTDMEKLEETKEQIKGLKSGQVVDIKDDPIGFGVTVLKVGVVLPEKQEDVEEVTAELNSLELVQEAEQQEMTLV